MKILKGKRYYALIDYKDGYVDIKEKEIFIPDYVSVSNVDGVFSWVYPAEGHPIPLEVFINCFHEV